MRPASSGERARRVWNSRSYYSCLTPALLSRLFSQLGDFPKTVSPISHFDMFKITMCTLPQIVSLGSYANAISCELNKIALLALKGLYFISGGKKRARNYSFHPGCMHVVLSAMWPVIFFFFTFESIFLFTFFITQMNWSHLSLHNDHNNLIS